MVSPHSLLSKGPLGTIWLAAYFSNKLKKNQILRTSVSSSVDKIIPEVHISYRVLAQLLLGVVRIFSKKVEILYHDCNKVLTSACKTKASSISHELEREARHVKGNAVTHDETVDEQISLTKQLMVMPSSHEVVDRQICLPDKSMAAAHHRCAIIIPEKLTLDSFEVVLPEECDSLGINQCHTIEGEEHDAWRFFPNKQHLKEVGPDFGFNSACFTPARDILSTGRIDIDLHINELYCSSFLEKIEMPPIDIAHLEDHVNISECTQSLDMRMDINAKGEAEYMRKLSEPRHLDFEKSVHEKGYTKASPVTSHDKASLPCTLGAASPEITIRTPAKMEQPRLSRKRKCLYDEMLVLSNMTLREGINNPSNLVVKRRKARHTSLASWKSYIFADLERAFMGQQIPCKPLEHRDISVEKTSYGKAEILKETTSTPNDFQPDYHDGSSEQEQSSHLHVSVDIPEPGYSSEFRVAFKLNEEPKEPSVTTASDLERDLAISSLDEAAIQKGSDFSVRTRYVARYLCQSFQNQNKNLNLSRVLDERKRSTCATFFYETLVLKTQGCIEVRQEVPHADIIVSAKPGLWQIT